MKAHLNDVYPRMIAAYVVGYSIRVQYMSENIIFKFTVGPDDTGVIISYDTQSLNMPAGGNL